MNPKHTMTKKCERLVNHVRTLSKYIDTEEQMQAVCDFLFDKTMEDPNFTVTFGIICKELAPIQVPTNKPNENEEQKLVDFRTLMETICQVEYEKIMNFTDYRNFKLKGINACTDSEKKIEMQLVLDTEYKKMRKRAVIHMGNIGELYKQKVISLKLILRYITELLDNKDDDSLECLCALFSTVGKDLEMNRKLNLQAYFQIMQETMESRHENISTKIRRMLQDVIDLRNFNWTPRRPDDMIDQLNIEVIRSGLLKMPRKDVHECSVSGGDHKKRPNKNHYCAWLKGLPNVTSYVVESYKMKRSYPPIEMMLESKKLLVNWGRRNNMKTKTKQTQTTAITCTTTMNQESKSLSSNLGNRNNMKPLQIQKIPTSHENSVETELNTGASVSKGLSLESKDNEDIQEQKSVMNPAQGCASDTSLNDKIYLQELQARWARRQNLMST